MDYRSLGAKIRLYRQIKGLTMEKCSEMAQISANYLGKIERSDSKPTVETLVRIARALGIGLDCLLLEELNLSGEEGKRSLTPVLESILAQLSARQQGKLVELMDSLLPFLKQNF